MKYLVTGGAGFIGCNLVRELIGQGRQVRVFDNFSTGKRENTSDFQDKIEVIEGDLRDFALVMEAVKGIDVIFHLAALPSVYRSVLAPNTTNEVNVTGTLNLLQSARVNGVKRVIYASSSSIYGSSPELPKREDMIPQPVSPYAVSKLAGEYYCQAFWHIYGVETIILRYFNVFGPHQDPTSQYSGVIAKFINAFLNHEPLTVFGDGEQSRDFTYVDDVVNANLLAASCDKKYSGEVFNVARGKRISLNQMIVDLKEIFKQEKEVNYTSPRPGDVKHSEADISGARQNIGFNPKISFKKGLLETINWYKNS